MLAKFRKIIIIVISVIVALILIIAIFVRAALPGIVKSRIEAIGSEKLGVAVTVGDVDLGLLQGKAVIQDVTIANPEGFEGNLLELGGGGANIGLLSLMSDTIVIDSIDVAGARLNFSGTASGRSNVQSLLDGMPKEIKEDVPGDDDPSEPKAEEPFDKSIVIKRVTISDTIISMLDLDTNKVVTTSLGNLEIWNAGYPAPGQKLPESIMTVKSADFDFALQTPDNIFEESTLVAFGESLIRLDLNQLLATLEAPQVEFPEFSVSDFVAYSEVLNPEDEDRDGADNHAQARATAMASMGQDATKDEEVAAEEPKKSIFQSATELITGSEEEKVAEVSEDAEAAPFDYVNIGLLRFTSKELAMIEHGEQPSRMAIYDLVFDASDLRYPQAENTVVAKVSLNPIERDSRLNGDAKGELLHTEEVGDFTANITADNQSLAGIGPFKSGRARFAVELEMKEQVGSGNLTFKSNGFELKQEGTGLNRVAMVPLQALGKVEGPEVTVPFSFKMRDSSWSEFGKQLGDALLKSVLEALHQSAKEITGSIGDVIDTEEIRDAAGALGDSIKSGMRETEIDEKLKKAGDSVEEEAEKLGEKIKGLF